MIDWVIASSLATAAGTLVLAVATFASVRSGSRSARVAERTLLAGLRPVLAPSRMQDPPEKILFMDSHWVQAPGGGGVAELGEGAIYLAIALRNVGTGMAVLHGWHFRPGRTLADIPHAPPEDFRRLTRDLFIPAGDMGFWQGALRDPAEPIYAIAHQAIEQRDMLTIEVLYGDHEGGQRAITRFSLSPYQDRWIASVSKHWNLDRPDPR